jgi:citrate synthase
MGFGHRVYKISIQEQDYQKKQLMKFVSTLGVDDPILAIAKKLEESALVDGILFQENYIKRRFLFWNYLQSFRDSLICLQLCLLLGVYQVGLHNGKKRENKEPIGRPRQIYILEGF